MKQYKSLDFTKFVCAILIIVLHTAPFSSYSKVLTFGLRNIVTIIAVPFFFVSSGFVLFKKLDMFSSIEQKQYMIRYLKRIIIMYGIWSLVYFPFVVIKWTNKGFSVYSVLEYIRDFLFEGSYSTIWFLPALFAATLTVFILRKKLTYKKVLLICCVVYLFTLGGSSYYGLAKDIPVFASILKCYYTIFDSIKNGICFGMLYVCIGALLSEQEKKQKYNTNFKKSFIVVIVLLFLLAVEAFLVAYLNWNIKGVDTLIFLAPFTYFFFKFVLSLEIKIKEETCIILRKYSILMFLCQRLPISIIDIFMEDTLVSTNSILYFIIVLVTTLLLASLIIHFSKKFKIIRYIY